MIFLIFISLMLSSGLTSAQEGGVAPAASLILPTHLALTSNINDFGRFADGGSDANWYIGFNNAWIVKLPPAPPGEFSRAFIGAKIGRAKARPNPNKPWLRELIDGKIYMALSHVPSFSSEQSYFLTETSDIAIEPDPQSYSDGGGSSEWFWAEIPIGLISFTQPNYLAIWSPTKYFLSASSAPILAAAAVEEAGAPRNKEDGSAVPGPSPYGQAAREARAWNNHSISGVPPRSVSSSLETPLNNISPALAIRLVPNNAATVGVREFRVHHNGRKAVIEFSAFGENIEDAWVEVSRDQLDWERIGRRARRQPFIFTIPQEKFPPPGSYLRGVARDVLGNLGNSEAFGLPYVPH